MKYSNSQQIALFCFFMATIVTIPNWLRRIGFDFDEKLFGNVFVAFIFCVGSFALMVIQTPSRMTQTIMGNLALSAVVLFLVAVTSQTLAVLTTLAISRLQLDAYVIQVLPFVAGILWWSITKKLGPKDTSEKRLPLFIRTGRERVLSMAFMGVMAAYCIYRAWDAAEFTGLIAAIALLVGLVIYAKGQRRINLSQG